MLSMVLQARDRVVGQDVASLCLRRWNLSLRRSLNQGAHVVDGKGVKRGSVC